MSHAQIIYQKINNLLSLRVSMETYSEMSWQV